MSKVTRWVRTKILPHGLSLLKPSSGSLIPSGTRLASQLAGEDSYVNFSMDSPEGKPPRTITGNLEALLEFHENRLTPAGQNQLVEELFCTATPSSSASVVSLRNGRALHSCGAVIDANNQLVADASGIDANGDFPGNPLRRSTLAYPRKVSGPVALLTGGSAQNYYHWLIDILPKMELLRSSNWKIDRYYIPQKYSFHRESARLLGIKPSQIIKATQEEHIQADTLVTPSLYGATANKFRIDALKSLFAESIRAGDELGGEAPLKIYVSRSRSRVRRIVNEPELKKLLRAHGFQSVRLEGLSMHEQISLFRRASHIVAPHGAGLANIAFCRPGTKVLEINTPYRISSLFTRLANVVDAEFHLHIASPEQVKRLDPNSALGDSNMRVEIEPLRATLVDLLEHAQPIRPEHPFTARLRPM